MKLKSVLENLDGIEESLKAAYTEKEGKFYLNVEGYNPKEVETLRTTIARVKDEKKEALARIAELEDKFGSLPDDFDIDQYIAGKDVNGDVEKKLKDQKDRLEAVHQKAMDKVTGERDVLKGRLDKVVVDNALNAAIAEAGVAAPFAPAVRAMFKDKVKVEYEGEEVIATLDNMPVIEQLKTWAGTDQGKHYIAAPANGGGGSGGNGGGGGNTVDNPFAEKTWNLTKQLQLQKDDPAKYETLKKAAGK
jgi:hypothetical protein